MKHKGRVIWLGLCCILLATGCTQTESTVRGFAMDTVTAITVYKKEDEKAAQAALNNRKNGKRNGLRTGKTAWCIG